MTRLALLIGVFITALGILGIAAPEAFLTAVRTFQAPPAIYLAAAIRVGVGVVLVRAAPASRAPTVLRVLGFLIAIGGLLTPLLGVWVGHVILNWLSAGGPALVRAWATVATALGVFVVYAIGPKRVRS